MRPSVVVTTMRLIRLGWKLFIRNQSLHTHADAVADLDQAAVSELAAVGHDVDRALARPRQRQQMPGRKPTDFGQGQLEPTELEYDPDRQLRQIRFLRGRAVRRIARLLHGPISS